MMLLYGDDANLASWVAAKVGGDMRLDQSAALGLIDGWHDGAPARLLAAVVYNRFVGFDVHMSIASTSPAWATRRSLWAFFAYPFLQLGCTRVTAATAADNEDAKLMLGRLGFKREGVLRRGFDGTRDAIVFGMLREECRWISRAAKALPAIHVSQIAAVHSAIAETPINAQIAAAAAAPRREEMH